MKLLIDANILLDVLAERERHYHNSSLIWKLCETGQADGCITALTVANLVYIMRKKLDAGTTAEMITKLQLIFTVEDFCVSDLVRAAKMKWNDFEDAVQSAAASRIHADFIITRNTSDFIKSPVKPLSPDAFLSGQYRKK